MYKHWSCWFSHDFAVAMFNSGNDPLFDDVDLKDYWMMYCMM